MEKATHTAAGERPDCWLQQPNGRIEVQSKPPAGAGAARAIGLHLDQPLDLAIALACAQHGAAERNAATLIISQAQRRAPKAFGLPDTPTCRICGCGDLSACWPPCAWVEPDLCSRCHDAGLHHAESGPSVDAGASLSTER